MTYKAAIIGCGNVAGGYDLTIPVEWSATHAGAYHLCEDTNLVAASDTDPENLMSFKQKWKVDKVYASFEEMLEKETIDILSICLPTEYHAQTFHLAIKKGIKAVYLEKPLSDDLAEAREMVHAGDQTIVSVNYFRRWNPTIIRLFDEIKNNVYGKGLSVCVHYNKGLFLNGSHFIDLVRWLFDEPVDIGYIRTAMEDPADPGIDFYLKFENGITVYFINLPASSYNFAQVDILLENRRFVIGQRGQKVLSYPVVEEPYYKQFNIIGEPEENETEWRNCTTRAVEEIVDVMAGKGKISCTLNDGLRVLEICHDIMKKKYKRGEYV